RNRDPHHRHARGEPSRETARRSGEAAYRAHRSRQRLYVWNRPQMNRPLHTWLLFGGCLAILLAGMGWATWTALRLDRAHAQAQGKADFEEKVRLALWRMDSTLAPLIVQESSRPYFTYNSFY